MTSTPEQLAKWLGEFESTYSTEELKRTERNDNGTLFLEYENVYRSKEWQGYHRRCQETEQAMKLAKFGAMVLRTYAHNGDITEEQVNSAAKETLCMHDAKAFTVFSPNTEATIKELLA